MPTAPAASYRDQAGSRSPPPGRRVRRCQRDAVSDSSPTPTPALRTLRTLLHLMVAGLLALAAVRAVAGRAADAPAVVAAAGACGALFSVGPLLRAVRTRLTAAAWWLAAVVASWLVLLAL